MANPDQLHLIKSSPQAWNDFANTQPAPFKADLYEADLGRADLREANLTGADLRGADLRGADLREAMSGGIKGTPTRLPSGWRVVQGYLVGGGADLSLANLSEADLREANLREANLFGADLFGAYLSGADLRGVAYDASTVWPEGFDVERRTALAKPEEAEPVAVSFDEVQPLSVPPLGSVLDLREIEELSEDDSLQLWNELEPLRTSISTLLLDDDLDDEVIARATKDFESLQSELHRIGGARAGAVRSYELGLLTFVAEHSGIKQGLAKATDVDGIEDLRAFLDSLNTFAGDPTSPEAMADVAAAGEGVVQAADPEASPGDTRRRFLEYMSWAPRRTFESAIDGVNDGVKAAGEIAGVSMIGGMAGGVIGQLVGGTSLAIYTGPLLALFVGSLAMGARTYRSNNPRAAELTPAHPPSNTNPPTEDVQ